MPRSIADRVHENLKRFSPGSSPVQRKVDVAFVKSTNHDDGPPKDKHVRKLLAVSEEEDRGLQVHLIRQVERNVLQGTDCVVVAKTLVLLHKLLREGGSAFKENFYKGFSHLFDHLCNFKDDASRMSWQLSTFIRAYSAFLHQRCILYSSYPYEQDESRPADLDTQGLLSELPCMQKAIDLGLQVGVSTDVVEAMSPGGLQGYAQHLVLGDVLTLCLFMMKAIPTLVETFFRNCSPAYLSEANDLCLIYKESRNLIERMSNLDESKLGHWGGLELTIPPLSLAESMQEAIAKVKKSPEQVVANLSGLTDISSTSSPRSQGASELLLQ
ncbi:ENTH domain-containing protein [Chloropicon primus]|uniref:ENTH domain-containing protein n=1 Tax=Chloropicon primus TaxID=1764295 RepID=A0A5B8MQD2_9CHLO|nr:hypothetical protein A3770_08p52040 [Chloropicon primus]UPR01910.1 ENTH domain-containing protein [Chloropicon primus]|mmetsp:Transcript_7706/g.21983  ORF Transcript_7706/g.21983 Transcript_7706/m.21983 type:complete len:327 (+) Transcript_7706:211-1191(+)|eukprot:QDZ22686.1 hypothetical protein A3770_08p52040 [Chloropicon primus]